ncbi:MAG: metallophosphoesterase [Lachnospiraceae bacterium]|nr:metallophosphoesterase [Lachnospiraceae bacterium]
MNELTVSGYRLRSPKIHEPVTFAFLSDLHGAEFGKGNRRLIQAVKHYRPDAVLVGGDMLVERYEDPLRVPITLLRKLAKEFPVYAANGNHEHRLAWIPARDAYPAFMEESASEAEDALRSQLNHTEDEDADFRMFGPNLKTVYDRMLAEAGVRVLTNENTVFEKGRTHIRLWGLDLEKMYFPKGKNIRMAPGVMDYYLGERPEDGCYDLLLAHHPNYLPAYAEWGADCVLSGHIHGGAVRVPGFGGLLSPNFTFFPRYTKGRYVEGACDMIVSAGLGVHSFKLRLNNPPDLVILKLAHGEKR